MADVALSTDRDTPEPCRGHPAGSIVTAARGDALLVAWASGPREGCWAEIDRAEGLRWVRELPFRPTALGTVGDRVVFVVERQGTRLCTAPSFECERMSPLVGAHVSFGADGVLFDFGAGLILARGGDPWEITAFSNPYLASRHASSSPRAGPCGDAWIIALDDHARTLVGATWTSRLSSADLVTTSERTYALSTPEGRAVDLCTGRRLPAPSSLGAMYSRSFAVREGRRGLAMVRAGSHDDGQGWYEYDYAGASQRFHARGAASDDVPLVVAAHIGAGVVWLVTLAADELRVEAHAAQ